MKQKKKLVGRRLLALILTVTMLLGMVPVTAFGAEETVSWAGAMNFNEANNQVTSIELMNDAKWTELKWQYPLNPSVEHGGAYYAGSQVIVDDYLYVTGGNQLHKVSLKDGICEETVAVPETAKLNETQYLCYGEGYLYFAIRESITAYKLEDLSKVWEVSGNFGQYHPIQYFQHDGIGYVWCNGNVLNAADGTAVTIKQKDSDEALDISGFAWSSGARVGKYFYVTDKCNVYAIDMSTWKVRDQMVYYEGTVGSSYNTSGQVAYDSVSNRLFWGCKNFSTKNLYSAKLGEDGFFLEGSLKTIEAGFTSVNAPVVYQNKVYLVGQGKPCLAVFTIDPQNDEISRLYTVGTSSLIVQTNPILSTAGETPWLYFFDFDGMLYAMEDKGESGNLVELAQSPNPSGVKFPNSYEPMSMDLNGNVYCYNESGYLFCYGKSLCEVPTVSVDLSTELHKVQTNSTGSILKIETEVSDGGEISYQWQKSGDGKIWEEIEGAVSAEYKIPTSVEETVFYRCLITNTKDEKTAKTVSSAAEIQVKELSSQISLNMAVNKSNSLTGAVVGTETVIGEKRIVFVKNYSDTLKYLALGAGNEGTFAPLKEKFTLFQGLTAGTNMPGVSNISNNDLYTNRYYRSAGFTLPLVGCVSITAEDGITTDHVYLVVDQDEISKYTVKVSGLISQDEAYTTANGITFTAENQTVVLSPVTETIGEGDEDKTHWTWKSSDSTVANVDENGTVKCIGGGEAVITFTCGQMTATCKVVSSAPRHTLHTYSDGKCTICGNDEPDAVTITFTLVKDGDYVIAKDEMTELDRTDITVCDEDRDGQMTLNDAFLSAHKAYSVNGISDFATESSSYGPFITKLWGIENSNVGYYQNGMSDRGLTEELKSKDDLTVYFYQDTVNYSDVYTVLKGQTTVSVGNPTVYNVSGIAGGTEVIPKGAAVTVYKVESDTEVVSKSTTVGDDSTFELSFEEEGDYIVELSGTAGTAPVIPSRLEVTVLPKTIVNVYVTVSNNQGNFVSGKSGDEIYRLLISASDSISSPDGVVSIKEVFESIHAQQHSDGSSAFETKADGTHGDKITKFWGDESGNFMYYFNDVYLSGSGTKTGTNGRSFEDRQLDTIVAEGDCLNAYILQDTGNWGDIYTYFDPITSAAIVGDAATLTVHGDVWGSASVPGGALVKVTDSNGTEQTEVNTTVETDGNISITFPKTGTYTVEVKSNGTTYVSPSRCMVTVNEKSGDGENIPSEQIVVTISVVNPEGGYFVKEKEYSVKQRTSAADLLKKTGLEIVSSENTDYGFYVESINGIGEFDQGSGSGWMYKVNEEFPDYSAEKYELDDGDVVEWLYTRDLGKDVGGGSSGNRVETPATGDSTILEPSASTNSKGEASVEIKKDELTSAVEEATKDNTAGTVVIAPEIKGDASKVTVELPKEAVDSMATSGKTDLTVKTDIATVTLPAETLKELPTDGKTVSVAVEAVKGDETAEAGSIAAADKIVVEVAVDNKAVDKIGSGVVASIPAKEVSATSVLVIVDAEGNETIVKKSAVADGEITALLDGSCTVVVKDNKKEFTDTEGHWGKGAAEFASSRELFNGVGNGQFGMNTTMNRAMMATVFYNLENGPEHDGEHDFHDVDENRYYAKPVAWAAESGVLSGYNDGSFRADAPVTREQLAVMLWNYSGKPSGIKALDHSDAGNISNYAKEAMQWAVENGVMSGRANGQLDPKGAATRAEVAQMFKNYIEKVVL